MIRTTEQKVRELGQFPDDVSLVVYLETASELVDEYLLRAGDIPDSRVELIERHLAAHYAALAGVPSPSIITSKSIAGASTSYGRLPPGKGLDQTPFGTTAKQLDKTKRELVGVLEGSVRGTWLGSQL